MRNVALLGLLTFMVGCGDKLPGTIESYGENNLFGSGEATIQVQEQGMVLNSKLILETNKGQWTFKVPKSAYYTSREFNVTSEKTGQKIGVSLRRKIETLGQHSYPSTQSCIYTGFCLTCLSGIGSNGCSYKFSALCSGSQGVEVVATDYRDLYIADFSVGRQPLGRFTSRPIPRVETYTSKILTSCN